MTITTPPVHPVELTDQKDSRGFSITLDKKTGYATQARFNDEIAASLQLQYTRHGFLDSVIVHHYFNSEYITTSRFDATTDESGNILSVLHKEEFGDQRLGLRYSYDAVKSNKYTQFYEPANIIIHPLYAVLEVLNWGPFQPDHERKFVSVTTTFASPEVDWDYIIDSDYINHQYDERGNLTGYTFSGEFTKGDWWGWAFRGVRTQKIEWNCMDKKLSK